MPTPTQQGPTRQKGILAEGGGFALYAAWLAVLWEGCVVVPLSAETPIERLGSIVKDAAVMEVLVVDERGMAAGMRLSANGSCSAVSILDVRPLEASASPTTGSGEQGMTKDEAEGTGVCQHAYLYYTSGSSGDPKGVLSGHAPMMNRLRWMWRQYPYAEKEICCQRVDHVFIDFVAEVFGPLSCGVPVLVVPYSVRRNPILMRDFICNHRVTRITLVPTLARLIVEAANTTAPARGALRSSQQTPCDGVDTITGFCFDSIRIWFLSGESLPWSFARGLAKVSLPTARLVNLYGSTEMAADVTFYNRSCAAILTGTRGCTIGEQNRKNEGALSYPIGRPITHCGLELMEVTDLERAGVTHDGPPVTLHKIEPTTHGRVGMVYIYGAALASRYWGKPAATAEHFPSYTWDSTSSSYHLTTCASTIPQAPEMAPNLTVVDQEPERAGKKSRRRDQRAVRLFRTGDLASFEPNETAGGDNGGEGWDLVYRGRLDQQIKIHGRRLDLGEVETCLLRVRGVTVATAAVVCTEDDGCGQDGWENPLGSVGNSVVGVVVSPKDVQEAVILTECRRSLPSFAVPQVVVITTAIPTLPGSGKVDRRKVRRMLLDELYHRHCSNEAANQADGTAIPTQVSTHQAGAGTEGGNIEETVLLIMAAMESAFKSHGEKEVDEREYATRRDPDTHFFAETGLSSVQAVVLLHELRHKLVACGRDHGPYGRQTVSLIDLYSHPTARSLAQWLVCAPLSASTESKGGQGRDPTVTCQETTHNTVNASKRFAGDSTSDEKCSIHESLFSGVTVRPMSADLWAETSALVSSAFLNTEPLLAARFKRCRTLVGPVGAAVTRRCYLRIQSRGLRSVLRNGGRVLTATSDRTGQVVGFTVGMELVESVQGSGFLASATDDRLTEDRAWTRPRSTDDALRAKQTPWLFCTGWLLGIPLRPLLRPVSDIIRELLTTYRRDRGWAYAPGDIMYISETGCRLDPKGKSAATPNRHGRKRNELMMDGDTSDGADDDDGIDGGGEVPAAILAELLERRLIREATAVGFIRALTICTNSVTAHVAREIGFKEVARISPVQTYHSPRRTATFPRWLCFPRMDVEEPPPRRVSNPQTERRPGPFARVAQEHAHVVLFEKVLAPTVPLGLLLDLRGGVADRSDGHGKHSIANCPSSTAVSNPTDPSEYTGVRVATTEHELWKIVPVGRISWGHRCEMLTMLANSLPFLASSGRAVEYMTEEVEQRQAAFVLLAASLTTGKNEVGQAAEGAAAATTRGAVEPREPQFDVLNGSLPAAPTWTVAACMSWRLGRGAREPEQNEEWASADDPMPSKERTGRGERGSSGPSASTSCRELLILAVGRRWRYRGVGASLVHHLLADSRRKGHSFVYVRSVLEAVGFYERLGFRRVESDSSEGKLCVAEFAPPTDGECGMVYDISRCFSHV